MRNPAVVFICSVLVVLTCSITVQADDVAISTVIEKAKAGDIDAQYYLGFQYELGIEVEQDNQQAHYWYEQAALQGDARSQYSLGYLYHEGIGVKRDINQAKQWYEKSSQQHYAEAQYALAGLYYHGIGIDADLDKAKSLFGKACDGGQVDACVEYQKMQALGM